MALRSQTQAPCLMLVTAIALGAVEYPVTHQHAWSGGAGVLRIGDHGVEYVEKRARRKPHRYRWNWIDIQRLLLAPSRIEITTYQDIRWQLGRDRRFTFRGKDFSAAYGLLRDKLPLRLIPEIALAVPEPSAAIPAKLRQGRSGREGMLLFAPEKIVFRSDGAAGSHTWLLSEVENISSSDPLELTVTSLGNDYRLQLKQPLPEAVYNGLWRKLNTRRTP